MRLSSWLVRLMGGERRSRPCPKHRSAPRWRPGLEALEDRCVPSTLTVDHTWDNSAPPGTPAPQGTLEWAAGLAQNGDTIVITGAAVNHGINLTHGEIVLTQQNLTIQTAAGKSPATISGDNLSRVFELASGASVTLADVNITGGNGVANNAATNAFDGEGGGIVVDPGATLAITGSTLSGNSAVLTGGGISNLGTLTVSGSTVSGNSASVGGGIFSYSTATITSSMISDNNSSAFGDGGGIASFGTLTLSGSAVCGNSAGSNGGGIENEGTLTLSGSAVCGNSAGYGGGIANFGAMTASSLTLSSNTAAQGGGIYNVDGTLTLRASTISNNAAFQIGGGILNLDTNNATTVNVSSSTISGNTAAQGGGGIYNDGDNSAGTVNVSSSTISGNTAAYGGGIFNGRFGRLFVTNASTVCGNTAPAGADLYNLGFVFISNDSDVCVIGP